MTRFTRERLVRAALLPALLLLASLGLAGANALWPAAPHRDSNLVFDADYVQWLAKLGIVKLPGYQPPPAVAITTK
jgi:hypothetical protein